jgi:vesicle coat complex subunit
MRRGDAIKVLTDISINEIYPFLLDIVKKGVHDWNPYGRRISIIGLYKV